MLLRPLELKAGKNEDKKPFKAANETCQNDSDEIDDDENSFGLT